MPLILLLLYVQFVLIGLNFPLFDSRELVLYLVWLPLVFAPYIFTRKTIIYRVITALLLIPVSINFFHIIVTSRPFTVSSLFILLNTNAGEAIEFTDTVHWWRVLLLVPYVILAYLSFTRVFVFKGNKQTRWVYAILLLFSLIFIAENIANNRFVRKGLNNEIRVWASISSELDGYKQLQKRTIKKVDAKRKDTQQNEIMLLVIGESLNRNHMALYGYHRNTNPLLSKRNDIVVYKNVVSPYTYTLGSILEIYTNSTINKKLAIQDANTLLDVFYSAGYETYWISNQSPIGVWDNAVFNIANTAQHKIFLNQSGNSSMETVNNRSYDELVIAPLKKILGKQSNQFITVHLLGSHTKYAYRYPATFNCFTGNATEKEKTINEYDNSVLYNDSIVNTLIETIAHHANQTKQKVTLFYLSDHGENVYDYNNEIGHNFTNYIPKCLVEIPYILWSSDTVTRLTAQHNTNKASMSDELFHHVIGLSNVSTTLYDGTLDINNSKFDTLKTRKHEDGLNYDLKKD